MVHPRLLQQRSLCRVVDAPSATLATPITWLAHADIIPTQKLMQWQCCFWPASALMGKPTADRAQPRLCVFQNCKENVACKNATVASRNTMHRVHTSNFIVLTHALQEPVWIGKVQNAPLVLPAMNGSPSLTSCNSQHCPTPLLTLYSLLDQTLQKQMNMLMTILQQATQTQIKFHDAIFISWVQTQMVGKYFTKLA